MNSLNCKLAASARLATPVCRCWTQLVLLLLLGLAVVPILAQQPSGTLKNPFAQQPAGVALGKSLFQGTCQTCHGTDAQGGRGPALAGGTIDHISDAQLFRTIHGGIAGTQMPAFSALPADDIWRIITYLRSLSTNASAANETVPGDPKAGERTFWGKGKCSQCHEVNARGGNVGPDLSDAGIHSAAYLRSVILNPNAPVSRGRRRFGGPTGVVVKTRDGQTIVGLKRAEDNFTLIMTDLSGKLRKFDKADLLSERPLGESLMPDNYGKLLSATEIQNLIAYLKSLKGRDLSKTIDVNLPGGLSFAQISNAQSEPGNWLTYWGNYQGDHFSELNQITPANVKQLQAQWTVQMPPGPLLEATPLVVNGVMYTTYTTDRSSGVYAIDARTGLDIWKYDRPQKQVNPFQINPFNRGVAVLGNRVFFGTLDAQLVALNAQTGRLLWETSVANTMKGYSITEAPLTVKNEVIVGVSGGEFGIRGFVDAYDAATGKRLWRFYTIPGPGQFGNDTWSGDSWERGSGAAWLTGSYDPKLNLLYWTVGNPGPNLNGAVRKGDNLFTCSVVALDADTGKLKWYYQFTPHDTHDWDANEDVVLTDATIDGVKRKLLLQADRNGLFYVLDRTNGKFIFAKPYVKQTWNAGFQPDGRPILRPNWEATPQGNLVSPVGIGGTDWQNPSYDPDNHMLYVVGLTGAQFYRSGPAKYIPGREYMGSGGFGGPPGHFVPPHSDLIAIDVKTGTVGWKYPLSSRSDTAGALATRGGLVFLCTGDGDLIAIDAKSGKPLWHFQTGSRIASSAMSYAVNGRQYVAVSAGNVLYSFALPN
jgi:PQQ-dependent dehydrogenase (methanol/ethanol family)